MKKILMIFTLFALMVTSSFAHENATFFSQTPTLTTYNATSGVGQVDFDVATANINFITARVELLHNVAGVLDTEVTTSLNSRDAVTYNFDLTTLGNYNGDYTVRVTVENEDDPTQNEVNQDVIFSYSNGVEYTAQQNEESSFGSLSSFITEAFGVIATLLSSLVILMTGDLITLAVVGIFIAGIISLFYFLGQYIKSHFKKLK
jgi:hypothetical protein